MIGSLESPPIVIRGDRGKWFMVFAGSLAFVGIAASFVAAGSNEWRNWFAVGFFGLCALVALCQLIKPSTLTITPEGLRYANLFRVKNWRWSEITAFTTRRPALLVKSVRMNFTYGPPRDSLGLDWEVDPEPLSELLNQALAKWRRRQ